MRINKEDIKKQNNNGITLIALVITIIVLLILAGISIAMLTGENGILTQANTAKTKTQEATAIEKVQVEVAGSRGNDGKLDYALLKTNLNHITGITGVPETITESSFPLTVTVDGYEIIINSNGTATAFESVASGEKAKSTMKDNYTDGTDSATIPAGFTVSSTENTISTGLVVIGLDGSEFVWVPVSEINDMAQCSTAGGTCNLVADSSGHLSCETHDNNTFIVGKLYATSTGENFSSTPNTTYNADSGLREPAIVKSYDNDTENYNTVGLSLDGLKDDYKLMAESVAKYGGFYVGRYEASLTSATDKSAGRSGTMQSKPDVIPTAANNSYTYMWYGLYDKAKGYTVSEDSVQSSMIWGSQYDAMLNWVKSSGSSDVSKITTQGIGNNSSGSVVTAGNSSYSNDSINKIRDLGGNLREWTLEAIYINFRAFRGGYYSYSNSPSFRDSIDPYGGTDYTGARSGTRLTLYIK